MSYEIIKDKGEGFSAYKTAQMVLNAMQDEAETGKVDIVLKGFNGSQADAVYYLITYALGATGVDKATGDAKETQQHGGDTNVFMIPGVGTTTRHFDREKENITISIQTEGKIPVHTMRDELAGSKSLFTLITKEIGIHNGTQYSVLPCPDDNVVRNVAMLLGPIIRGHGYSSEDDVLVADVKSEDGMVPALIVNKEALAYVMKHEQINTERHRS